MTPEQWSVVGKIYEAALERSAVERASFVANACGGNELLESEVHSLLAAEQQAGDFLEEDAAQRVAPLPLGEPSTFTGRKLRQYELGLRLGSGGMGEVYRALDTRLKREVAVKVLRPSPAEDIDRLRRFEREAQAASCLNSPNIVTIYETGEVEDCRFLAMELVEGQTLRQLIDVRLSLDEVVRICLQVAQALKAAHAANIVHRDIKPENVMLRPDGYVKVLDFGLARFISPMAGTRVALAHGASAITEAGIAVGTLRYMSPEQAQGKPVTGASDIFSLGIVMYELATARHPFRRETEFGSLDAILTEAAFPASRINPEIPSDLDQLILRMLDKHPAIRPSAADVERALGGNGLAGKLAFARSSSRTFKQTVGRQPELSELSAMFESAAIAQGRLCCVSGEPGIGKTTLVEDFLSGLAVSERRCLIARGRCSERLAGTDAYSPFLEALEEMQRCNSSVAEMLRRLAPDWYSQAGLATSSGSSAKHSRVERAYSQERLKRELGVFLQELSRRQTVILFLEDLHWADFSTIDLLAFVAGRITTLRLFIIVTFRSSDLLLARHPFLKVKQELQARGIAHEIKLGFLKKEEVEEYLSLQFPQHGLPAAVTEMVYAKTEGSPLFLSALLRYFRDRKIIVHENGRWLLAKPLPDVDLDLPESMRAMIERIIGQLDENDHRLLVAASVQGHEFDSAVVAIALQQDEAFVEERLEILERVHQFTILIEEHEFPNKALSLRYRFTHVLYQNALYATLQPARRATLSNAVAEALITAYGDRTITIASDLARLFEVGRSFMRAAEFYLAAAKNATQVFAANEAAALARQGLSVIRSAFPAQARSEIEYSLQLVLGQALMVLLGYGAPEVVEVYERVYQGRQNLSDSTQLLPVLYGLWVSHLTHAELERALEIGREFLNIARRIQSPATLVGERMVGCPLFYLGQLSQARPYLERAAGLYDPVEHRPLAWLYGQEPGMTARSYLAWTMWLLGYFEKAADHNRESLRLAREVEHALSRGHGLFFAAVHDYLRQDWREFREVAGELIRVSQEWKIAFWLSAGRVLAGLVMAKDGDEAAGIAEMRIGIATSPSNKLCLSILYRMLAEACADRGQTDQAIAAVDTALDLVQSTRESFVEPELHRFRGELLLRAADFCAEPEAESCFLRALHLARKQSARSWELRAAVSLSRLWARQKRNPQARELLAPLFAWFQEGHETADLQAAKALLEEL